MSTLEDAVEAATLAPESAALEDIGDLSGWETRGGGVDFSKWQVMVNKLNETTIDCANIDSWISLSGDFAFSHQNGIHGFKFPKRFLDISPEISLFCQS